MEISLRRSQVKAVFYKEGKGTGNLIVIFGWLGCRQESLKRYVDVYSDIGLSSLAVIAPISFVYDSGIIPPEQTGYRNLLIDIEEFIITLSPRSKNVFFKFFSNGGAFAYEAMTLNARLWSRLIRGVIFDSSPVDISDQAIFRAIVKQFGYSKSLVLVAFFMNNRSLRFGTNRRVQFKERMFSDVSTFPQLYLYSVSDEITDFMFIESLIKQRRKRGINVSSRCWLDTAHVSHNRSHREEYAQITKKFIMSSLGAKSSTGAKAQEAARKFAHSVSISKL